MSSTLYCKAIAVYAGQSVGLVSSIEPAASIVARLVAETAAALQRAQLPFASQ
jgi:hypothetical protein